MRINAKFSEKETLISFNGEEYHISDFERWLVDNFPNTLYKYRTHTKGVGDGIHTHLDFIHLIRSMYGKLFILWQNNK